MIEQLTWRDGLIVGFAQCLALVPGVSRSGSTISAGLFLAWTASWPRDSVSCSASPRCWRPGCFRCPTPSIRSPRG